MSRNTYDVWKVSKFSEEVVQVRLTQTLAVQEHDNGFSIKWGLSDGRMVGNRYGSGVLDFNHEKTAPEVLLAHLAERARKEAQSKNRDAEREKWGQKRSRVQDRERLIRSSRTRIVEEALRLLDSPAAPAGIPALEPLRVEAARLKRLMDMPEHPEPPGCGHPACLRHITCINEEDNGRP